MIAQFVLDRFFDGVLWLGWSTVFGFGCAGAINLFKSFGGVS